MYIKKNYNLYPLETYCCYLLLCFTLKGNAFKMLVFVVLVTDVRGLPNKSFKRKKFSVEIHSIDFLLLYHIY